MEAHNFGNFGVQETVAGELIYLCKLESYKAGLVLMRSTIVWLLIVYFSVIHIDDSRSSLKSDIACVRG